MTDVVAQPPLVVGDVIKITAGTMEGELRFFRGWQAKTGGGRWAQHSPANVSAPYSGAYAEEGAFEVVPAPPVRGGYSLVHHLLPRIFGWKPWEHVEEMDGAQVANMLPGGGWMNGFLSGEWHAPDGRYDSWAKFALVAGQGIPYTGEAYVLVYGREYVTPPRMPGRPWPRRCAFTSLWR
jgi:hypothetical protein